MPIETLLINAHLVTMADDGLGVIQNAALAISNKIIHWLGPMDDLDPKLLSQANDVMDLEGRWVTPGLIDCHTHLVFAGNRSHELSQLLNGQSYAEIAAGGGGILSTVKATRDASVDELLTQSSERLENLINEGVTTVEIKSGYGLDFETERKMLHVARLLSKRFPVTIKTSYLGAHVVPPEFQNDADNYIDLVCNEYLPKLVEEDLVDAVDVFCEKIAFTPAQVEKVFQAAKQLNIPIKCHAEQLSDSGAAMLAAKYQALSVDHLEYLTEESVKALKDSQTTAVLLPGAYYYLQEKRMPPIDLLRQYQIPIAVASDCNPGSSPICSLLTIMNMACVLFRLTPEEVLKAVTINAAKALGLADRIGSLEVGKKAELAIWDINSPTDLLYMVGLNPHYQTLS